MTGAESSQWAIADLLRELIDDVGLAPKEAFPYCGKYENKYLRQLYHVGKAIPGADRNGAPFFAAHQAYAVWHRMNKSGKAQGTPLDVFRMAVEQRLPARKIRQHFAGIERANHQEECRRIVAALPRDGIERFRNEDCRVVLSTLADGSVKLFWNDPPFAGYSKKGAEGKYCDEHGWVAGLRMECDNATTAEAFPMVIETLALALPKLAPGGCMVLWQAGGRPDRWQLLQAAEEQGWAIPHAGFWSKARPKPGNLGAPMSVASERILILCRKGEELFHHRQLSRRDHIDGDTVTEGLLKLGYAESLWFPERSKADRIHRHAMQKPESLSAWFLEKHSHEGELCVDLCGCSGSFCIAAERLKRRWIYCESNRTNFEWGASRIKAEIDGHE